MSMKKESKPAKKPKKPTQPSWKKALSKRIPKKIKERI